MLQCQHDAFPSPDAFYFANSTRRLRACQVTEKGCEWLGLAQSVPWRVMMEIRAATYVADMHRQNATSSALPSTKNGFYEDVYLYAGLMAGTPRSLYRLFRLANIAPEEDDQAALSGYWYWNNHDIVLDYGQTLFGSGRFMRKANPAEGCVFDVFQKAANDMAIIVPKQIVHTKTGSTPLFFHSPNKYWECHEAIGRALGLSEPLH
jgi:hypothetical protein